MAKQVMWQEGRQEECDGCPHVFGLGDSIYILHLGMERRDYCKNCKEIIERFLGSLKRNGITCRWTDITE